MVKSGGAARTRLRPLPSPRRLRLERLDPAYGAPPADEDGGAAGRPGEHRLLHVGRERDSPEVSGERTVDPNGELFLPFLGTVHVVGMETADIRRLLEERYGALYSDPVVEVVTNVNVNITGAVRIPGRFYVPPSATLVDALALAAGVTSEIDLGLSGGASDASQVRLVRNGVATVLDLRPLDIRPEILGLQIQSGTGFTCPGPKAPNSESKSACGGMHSPSSSPGRRSSI